MLCAQSRKLKRNCGNAARCSSPPCRGVITDRLPCAESRPSRLALDLDCGKAALRLSRCAVWRSGVALSTRAPAIITVSSATRRWRAGKMFFALHAEIIFAYLLRHFSRKAGTRRSRCAARRQGHALRARATACGRPPRPAAERPAGRDSNALRAKIVPRNQDHGRTAGGGKSCTSIKTAGPCCWRARSCCPCRCPGFCLAPGSGSGSCLALWLSGSGSTGDRSRPGVPGRRNGAWGKGRRQA